jgi:hypothetical protein
MSEKRLDTIYWEVRGHDGCYAVRESQSIALIQHLFDLYDPTQALRIRTADGDDFTTQISNRVILEFFLAPSHGRSLPCAGEHDIHHRRLRFNAALRLGFWPPWSRERRGGARHGLNAVRRARAREGRRNVHAWLTRRLLRHGRAGGGRAQAPFRTPPGRRRSRRAVAARHLASSCGTAR